MVMINVKNLQKILNITLIKLMTVLPQNFLDFKKYTHTTKYKNWFIVVGYIYVKHNIITPFIVVSQQCCYSFSVLVYVEHVFLTYFMFFY